MVANSGRAFRLGRVPDPCGYGPRSEKSIAWAGASPANSAIWVIQEKSCFKNRAWNPKL
jgi:hypothetical protein